MTLNFLAMDRQTRVAEIMTSNVLTLHPIDTMDKVKLIFNEHPIHHIPVVKDGKVVGIISKSDYLTMLHGFTLFKNSNSDKYNDALLRSLLVREVMTQQVATLRIDETLETAASYFRENLFHALPIVDKAGKLVGIITTYDLVNHAYLVAV